MNGHRGQATNLLDHGVVRLVDYMGSDLSVIQAARVSYNAAWRAGADEGNDTRLLRRLWSGGKPKLGEVPKHSSPFEAVTFTFEVKAPIFVFRQWHRHRTQSYNELSLRYKELPTDDFYVPEVEVMGLQSLLNKQGRELRTAELSEQDLLGLRAQQNMYRWACETSFDKYRDLLESGMARELARGVLPVSTYSHMFTTGNLLNYLKFLMLRVDSHAQFEIRVYATAMATLMDLVVPRVMDLWREARETAEAE